MSSLNFTVYIGPREGGEIARTRELLSLLKKNAFEEVRKKYPAFVDPELDDFFGYRIVDGLAFAGGDTFLENADDGTCIFGFLTSTSFDTGAFVRALIDLDGAETEILVYNDQVGEYAFIKDGRRCSDYEAHDWKWLSDPEAGAFEGERVVVTGTFAGYVREDVEELVEEFGGIVQNGIGKTTTLVVVGTRPGAAKIVQATERGIRQMKEDDFLELIGD